MSHDALKVFPSAPFKPIDARPAMPLVVLVAEGVKSRRHTIKSLPLEASSGVILRRPTRPTTADLMASDQRYLESLYSRPGDRNEVYTFP